MCRIYKYCAIFCGMAAVSCIGVDFAYTDDAPEGFGTSKIDIGLNWQPDVQESLIPDDMTVLMARNSREIHYMWKVGNDGFLPGDAPVEPVVRTGEYRAAAFNAPENIFTIEGLDKFSGTASYPMSSVTANLPVISAPELKNKFDITSEELGYEYSVIGQAARLWHAYSEISVDKNEYTPLLEFAPADLSVEFTFSLQFRVSGGVGISSVIAALTGVPSSVCLMDGTMTQSSLHKVAFRMNETQNTGSTIKFTGNARTLGISYDDYGSFLAGPGIVWIAVDAYSGTVKKRLYTGINIMARLKAAGIMTHVENGYKVAKNSASIDLGTFSINTDRLVSGDNAIEEWINQK